MSAPSHGQDARTEQSGKRRRRKDRAASRAPEPKQIVSGAGQPLDASVRRELEEALGHDLGRVRLHTDRDADALTGLLGADAVAVGQDVFFRDGAYVPGTAEGRRLLAHELLHTVQNQDGLGALRAGRDLGAVSLPQQAVEREAEAAARDFVRDGDGQAAQAVEEGRAATPGWLRYATVDADRTRLERIDPATLVDRLAASVARSLRGDPEDRSQRTRRQLVRLPDELLEDVLARLESRLLTSEHERLLDLVEEAEAGDALDPEPLAAPPVENDLFDEVEYARETERRRAEDERDREQRTGPSTAPKAAPGRRDGAGDDTREDEEWHDPSGDGPGRQPGGGTDPGPAERADGADGAEREPGQAPAPAAGAGQRPDEGEQASGGGPGQQAGPGQDGGAGTAPGGGKGTEAAPDGGASRAPAASKEESAARNRPGAVDALVAGERPQPGDRAGQEKPAGPAAPGRGTQEPGRTSRLDGARTQDVEGPEEKDGEEPSDSTSEVDAGGGERSAWDVALQPDDFLPQQDPDVSAVPTAERLDPSSSAAPAAPAFPAPPPTRADKVQAERDAEDAADASEDAREAEPEEDGHAAGPAEPEKPAEAAGATASGRGGGGTADAGPGGAGAGTGPERATAPPAPGSASKDPASGTDPKAGPVAAQTAVQESRGGSAPGSDEGQAAAEQQKGTGVAADGAGAERASAPAAPAKPAPAEPAAAPEPERAGATAPASPSPARDSHVTGGGSRTEDRPATSAGGGAKAPAPRAPEAPAPAAVPAPKGAGPAKSGAAPARRAAPAARGSRGGGRGGGGGTASPAKGGKDPGPAPDLSAVAPEAGLATASKLKPHKALEAMGGVGGSVDRTVGEEHTSLAAAPPSMERPAGAPRTLRGKPRADAPAAYAQDPAAKSEAPRQEDAEVTGAKEPEGQIEAEKAEEPGGWDTFKMALGFGIGKVLSWVGFEVDASELAAKFAGLPTRDEALAQAQAGNAPGVEMQGAAERTAGEQGSAVDAKGQETVATGRDDAGRPMGEDQVYPDAPKERMAAKVPGGQGGAGGPRAGGAATGAVPPEAASEVAEHERGPQFQAAFGEGRKQMSEGRQKKDTDFRTSQEKHRQKVDAEVASNTAGQAAERDRAMADVTAQRAGWRAEQDEELGKLGDKKTERHEKVRKDVQDKEKQTDDDVAKEKDDGDRKIRDENTRAERDAEKKRDDSVEDSGNWVTKAFDWIKKKVIEIKDAIVRVIKAARDAVVGFIKNFKETVERWIDAARKFVVDTIKQLVDDLVEFAKAMVRAIVELAARVRKFVTDLIAAAIALVNRLADALKQAVSDLLDAIGKLLSSILDFLKKMLQAAVKAVVDAVKAVLDFASKLLSALGDWMLIAVDFLSDPGGWLGGAKNSAVDGAKNHLFAEVSSAVKQWFREKIQEIIGVPKAVIDKLVRGGWTLDKIVKEAWDAVVPQLPLIIGELVLTKVVAKLIPGAGWVMAVIDAIRTAWGALSAILRALGMVLDWLKAVRGGGAGILFAKAVAAGVVALLEVLYQALLSGIGKYVSKVGRRLKDVAAKLGKPKPGKPKSPGAPDAPADGRPAKPEDRAPGKSATPDRPTDTKRPAPPKSPAPPKKPADRPKPLSPPAPTHPKDSARPDRPKETSRPQGADTPKPRTTDPSRPRDTGRPDRPGDRTPDRAPKRRDDTSPDRRSPDREDSGRRPRPKDDKGKDRDRHKDKDKDDKSRDRRPKDKDPAEAKQRKKDERKKKEDSKESKEERLRKIVARIRPPVTRLLRKGVGGTALRATLTGLRTWHRLTSLSLASGPVADILARLNPQVNVTTALTMSERDLLDLLDEVAYEILDAPVTEDGAQRIRPDSARGTEKSRYFSVPTGVGFASVARFLRTQGDQLSGHQKSYVTDFFEFDHDSGETSSVAHYTKGESERIRNATDRRVHQNSSNAVERSNNRAEADGLHLQRGLIKRQRADGSNERELRYLQRKNRDAEPNVADRLMETPADALRLAQDVEHMAQGGRVSGQDGRDAAFFGTLALAKEAHRNPRALITSGMIVQIATQGSMVNGITPTTRPQDAVGLMSRQPGTAFNLKDALPFLPMEQQKAMKSFADLEGQRESNPAAGATDEFRRKGPTTLANREILALQVWIKSLDLKTDSGGEISTKKELKEKIRTKMSELYGT